MKWARFHPKGYECSSRGDKRFSALFAVLPDGRTIEEAYQLDVKGYRGKVSTWREAKGRPPILPKTNATLWDEYLMLWREWAANNPELILDLRAKAVGGVLTDMFASSQINQARALSVIISEQELEDELPYSF